MCECVSQRRGLDWNCSFEGLRHLVRRHFRRRRLSWEQSRWWAHTADLARPHQLRGVVAFPEVTQEVHIAQLGRIGIRELFDCLKSLKMC